MVISGKPIAHRRPSDGATHDLEEHLRSAALLAGKFAEVWGASETAALAALWHDLGKYAAEFQAMIATSDPKAHLEVSQPGPESGSVTPAPARSVRPLTVRG
jgi:CRISPR-associated endonuclease/helicase Cas3